MSRMSGILERREYANGIMVIIKGFYLNTVMEPFSGMQGKQPMKTLGPLSEYGGIIEGLDVRLALGMKIQLTSEIPASRYCNPYDGPPRQSSQELAH
jgi:hypothetical protein